MQTSFFFRIPAGCLAALAALLLLFAPLPGAARAAGLAADHTVLYYLIEMQRRVRKNCGGRAMPEAPSLSPSSALRDIAGQSLASGQPPEAMAASSGLAGIPFLATTASGNTPQQAFESLNSAQCPELMGRDYRYVGAAASGGRWAIILAAAEPASTQAAPAAPAVSAGGGGAAGRAHGAPAPYASSEYPEPTTSPEHYDPSQPPQPGSWGGPGDLRIPEERRREAAPAPPVVVGEMHVDASGQAYGPLLPPSDVPDPFPAPPPPVTDSAPGLTPPAAPSAQSAAGPKIGQEPGASAPPSFVPPQQPGPFGANAPLTPQTPARPGVVPLQDSRPDQPQGPMGFVAPDPGQSPLSSGSAETRPAPLPDGAARTPAASGGDMLDLVNKARARGGNCGGEHMPPAPPLSLNPLLVRTASAHAADMSARRYFSSTTPEGVTLGRRLTAAGYEWGLVAENIAALNGPAEDVLRSWLAEARQCRNIMGAEYRDAGLGRDASGRHWVFTLAAPMEGGAIRLR